MPPPRAAAPAGATVAVPRAALLAATAGFLAAGALVLAGVFMDRWHSLSLDGRITVAGLRVWTTAGDAEFTVAGPGSSTSTAAALFPMSCGDGGESPLASAAWRLDLVWGFVVAAACMCFVSALACGGIAIAKSRTAARFGSAVTHVPAVLCLVALAIALALVLHTFSAWLYCGVPACAQEAHRRSPPQLRASVVDSSSGDTAAATAPQGSCRDAFEPSFVLLCIGGVVAVLTHLFVTWVMSRFLSRIDRDRRVTFYNDEATAANVAAHASRSRAARHHPEVAGRARLYSGDGSSDDNDSDGPRKRRPPALPGDDDFDDADDDPGYGGALQIVDEQQHDGADAAQAQQYESPGPRQPAPLTTAQSPPPAAAPPPVLGDAGSASEWLWMDDAGMYYSEASATFWDPASGFYFDPSAQEWIDPSGVRFST